MYLQARSRRFVLLLETGFLSLPCFLEFICFNKRSRVSSGETGNVTWIKISSGADLASKADTLCHSYCLNTVGIRDAAFPPPPLFLLPFFLLLLWCFTALGIRNIALLPPPLPPPRLFLPSYPAGVQ